MKKSVIFKVDCRMMCCLLILTDKDTHFFQEKEIIAPKKESTSTIIGINGSAIIGSALLAQA
ncbi:MAG: hypothetical protein IJT30_10940 [Muribaculaceae bacterium]|nr:hypothetical protein [Muribaculaceae bacterium]